MKFSERTLRLRAEPGWRARLCFYCYACDDVFRDSWFLHSMMFVARFTSFFVVELGMGLVVFCTVVSAREVVPVLARNSPFMYHFLNFLVVVASFSILFNYVCANTFSCRIGKGPHWSAAPPDTTGTPAGQRDIAVTPSHSCREEIEGKEATDPAHARRSTAVRVPNPLVEGTHGESRLPQPRQRWGVSYRSDLASCLRPCGDERTATASELAELDRVAAECDRYSPRERRHKLLDEPRRFCIKCNRLKAPREHHCNVCGLCVPKMDHHCPWINSCVDAENMRYFCLFLLWLTIGCFLDATILGYGFLRQHRYEKQVRALRKAHGAQARVALPIAPFGPQGSRLTAFPVVLTITITGLMFFCLCVMLYSTMQTVLKNTTIIEQCIVEDKQELYKSTSFVYQNPYDLGAMRNLIEVFRTHDDPVVRDVLAFGWSSVGHDTGSRHSDTTARRPRRGGARLLLATPNWQGRLLRQGQQALVLAWLLLPPTIRGAACDGIHYPTFSTEAAGDDDEELV